MFGRRNTGKTWRQWKNAPAPGVVDVRPDATPDADLAASVLHRVLVEVGGEQVRGFTVEARVRVNPLTFVVDALWNGVVAVLGDEAEGVAEIEDAATALNWWNARHTVPRAHTELDAAGRIRVRVDSELVCGAGVTVQQLDEWMRRALAGVTAVGEFLDARWSGVDSSVEDTEDTEDAGGLGRTESTESTEDAGSLVRAESTEDAEAVEEILAGTGEPDDAGKPIAEGDITALVTPGNRYGLLGGGTPALLLPRLGKGIEVKEAGASGRRGNGYLRFAAGPDVALHDGTMTVTDSVALGEVDAEIAGWLHMLCDRMNALPGGVVVVVDNSPAGLALTCATHRPIGSGLSDAQVEDAVTRGRAAVAECVSALIAEVTGDSGGADGADAEDPEDDAVPEDTADNNDSAGGPHA